MGKDASSWSPPLPVKTWEDLHHQGFSLIRDDIIGLPEKFRENFHQAYFNDAVLRHDEGDLPADRERARDVIYYEWSGSELKLSEYQTIVIRDRAGIKGDRLHKRVEVLADPQAEEFVRALLGLIPPERRQPRGTFGINLFRTHTDVVTRPHHDDEEFIILYVMHRDGDGARSYLFRDSGYRGSSATNPPGPEHQRETPDPELGLQVLDYQLNPGEMLIFDDTLFKHGATPLEALPGSKAMRDAVICSVDYATTYLEWETAS